MKMLLKIAEEASTGVPKIKNVQNITKPEAPKAPTPPQRTESLLSPDGAPATVFQPRTTRPTPSPFANAHKRVVPTVPGVNSQ